MARRAIVDYSAWYNGTRLHSTLSYSLRTSAVPLGDLRERHIAATNRYRTYVQNTGPVQ